MYSNFDETKNTLALTNGARSKHANKMKTTPIPLDQTMPIPSYWTTPIPSDQITGQHWLFTDLILRKIIKTFSIIFLKLRHKIQVRC